MPNQMAMKFLGNSKILPFLGIKSEFNHYSHYTHYPSWPTNDREIKFHFENFFSSKMRWLKQRWTLLLSVFQSETGRIKFEPDRLRPPTF